MKKYMRKIHLSSSKLISIVLIWLHIIKKILFATNNMYTSLIRKIQLWSKWTYKFVHSMYNYDKDDHPENQLVQHLPDESWKIPYNSCLRPSFQFNNELWYHLWRIHPNDEMKSKEGNLPDITYFFYMFNMEIIKC